MKVMSSKNKLQNDINTVGINESAIPSTSYSSWRLTNDEIQVSTIYLPQFSQGGYLSSGLWGREGGRKGGKRDAQLGKHCKYRNARAMKLKHVYSNHSRVHPYTHSLVNIHLVHLSYNVLHSVSRGKHAITEFSTRKGFLWDRTSST